MSYIEREAAIKAIENDCPQAVYYTKRDAIDSILAQPLADVVSVVRCKDCVSSRPLNRNDRFEARYCDGCIYCMRADEGVSKDDYCSYGERREENEG